MQAKTVISYIEPEEQLSVMQAAHRKDTSIEHRGVHIAPGRTSPGLVKKRSPQNAPTALAAPRCGKRLGGGRRLAGRRRLGGGGGLATAAPRSQLGDCLSLSLSFSLSRGFSVLISDHTGHRQYLYVSTRVPAPGL